MSLVRGLWRGMLVGVAALGFSSFSLAAEFTLRLHSFEPPQGTSLSQTIVPWAKRIEAASNGRVRIKIFPAMQLGGKPPELYNQVKDGVVDIAWTVLGYTPELGTAFATIIHSGQSLMFIVTGAIGMIYLYVARNK